MGGPNQRKDYHLEEGEELFFMRKGDMTLKILQNDQFKDVHIKQGQVFLLPGRIPHSPQRFENTVGLVIERERLLTETDGLRYYVQDGSTNSLYERWFYCDDLGSQLGPIIKAFFASEQFKTGQPIPEDMPETVPWEPDNARVTEEPFDLNIWIQDHMAELQTKGNVALFKPDKYQSDVFVHGFGDQGKAYMNRSSTSETFFWLVQGDPVTLKVNGELKAMQMDDTLLVPKGTWVEFQSMSKNSALLSTTMDARNRSRVGF